MLKPYSKDYRQCDACHTLVSVRGPKADPALVVDDNHDFYGKQYWEQHQSDLGYPGIEDRAYSELPERCAFWLRHVLEYRTPPAKTLELGCSHGGLVYLMRLAGYDAAGLELSPWVADFARREFDVPMFCGPAERQGFAAGQFDMLLMMDVVEHFFSPLESLRRYVEFLAEDAILVLQTPKYDPAVSYEVLRASDGPFLAQLKGPEHLYLFSDASLRQLLSQVGFVHCESREAIFSQYDQFVFASRRPLCGPSTTAPATVLAGLDRPSAILLRVAMEGQKRSTFLQAACDERLRVIRDCQLRAEAETLRVQESDRRCEEQSVSLHRLEQAMAVKCDETSSLSAALKSLEADRDSLSTEIEALRGRAAADGARAGALEAQLAEQTARGDRLADALRSHESLLEERAAVCGRLEATLKAVEAALADSARVRSDLEFQTAELAQRCALHDTTIGQLSLEVSRQQESLQSLGDQHADLQGRRAALLRRIGALRADLRQARSERASASRKARQAERCVAAEAALAEHLSVMRETLAEALRSHHDVLVAQQATVRVLGEQLSSTALQLARVTCEREQAVTFLKDACCWRWIGMTRKRTIQACLRNLGVDPT